MTVATTNPLLELQQYGQSIWLDYIRRSLITSGELQRLIKEDGLRGVTSNPAIFEKAITGSTDYKELLDSAEAQKLDAKSLYERLAVRDIQDAADLLRPVYEQSKRRDGYVSLEVSPTLAHDTMGTLQEARRLWKTVARENVMIKVPATPEGIPAVQELIGEGINVNVTLLFSRDAYEKVARAYIAGLEEFARQGGDLSKVASVASFFISRIDTAIDNLIKTRLAETKDEKQQVLLKDLGGKVAIANAKLTYRLYKEIFSGPAWQTLASHGAQTQRVLWASTSSKNPAYRDVVYVEELIGPETVDTVPPATLDAFRNHGHPRQSLTEDLQGAQNVMDSLERAGISMKEVTDKVLVEGVQLFADAFDKLLKAVDRKGQNLQEAKTNRQSYKLPPDLDAAVRASLEDWKKNDKVRRLWARTKFAACGRATHPYGQTLMKATGWDG